MAAGADVLPDAVVGDFGHEVPAAGAFVAGGGPDGEPEAGRLVSQNVVQRGSEVTWRERGI